MASRNVKMKLLGCICVYALTVVFSVSNGQNNSTDHRGIQNEHRDINETTGYESTDGQNFTTESSDKVEGFGKDIKTEIVTDYNSNYWKKVNKENNSTTFNFTETTTHTIGNDSKTDYTGLNGTDVTEQWNKGGNLSDKKQDQGTTTNAPEAENKASTSWGYVILILILLLVLALCIILLYMRRVSRTYSFDLQRPAPVRTNEPIGTFEPVYLDDLDYQIHTVGNAAAADDANGTVLSNEDKEPNGEVENEEPQTNGLQIPAPSESSPTERTEPDQDQQNQDQPDQDQTNQDQDQLTQDQSPSPILFIEEAEEETNVNNNNNPMVRSSDPFVEINLDEPQQILTSSSSVQPFSPSIFSSLS